MIVARGRSSAEGPTALTDGEAANRPAPGLLAARGIHFTSRTPTGGARKGNPLRHGETALPTEGSGPTPVPNEHGLWGLMPAIDEWNSSSNTITS